MSEQDALFPTMTKELAAMRRELAPQQMEAFKAFSQAVFAEGAISKKHKQLIAVAVAHVTQCPYCIKAHTKIAAKEGATPQEIMEAIWIASEMQAGAAYAHATIALDSLPKAQDEPSP